MSDSTRSERLWALVRLQLRESEPPVVHGWEVSIDAVHHQYGPTVTDTMPSQATIRIDVQRVVLSGASGELTQPWVVRLYLEACVAALGIVANLAGFTAQEVVDEAETVIDVLATLGGVGAPWGRMALLTAPRPASAVLLWQTWTGIAAAGALSLAEMAVLLAGNSPTLPESDRPPEGFASRLDAAHEVFAELHAHLKADRIPAVIRRPAAAYGGLNIVQMIQAGRTEELLVDLRDSFAYGSST